MGCTLHLLCLSRSWEAFVNSARAWEDGGTGVWAAWAKTSCSRVHSASLSQVRAPCLVVRGQNLGASAAIPSHYRMILLKESCCTNGVVDADQRDFGTG